MPDIPYQVCNRCVMDTSDPEITFDQEGICNHCHEYAEKVRQRVVKGEAGIRKMEEVIAQIKADGQGKEYDCILGLSGGVDSSYVALKAYEYGLRPLVVHMDNGWNSELAVNNVENIVNNLGYHLYTLVVNWEEFRDIQRAYLKAGVIDIEVVTDHAISGTIYRLAKEYNLHYTLSGSNVATEGVLPSSWVFPKNDHLNLKAIHKAYGSVKLKTYPIYTFKDFVYATNILKIRSIPILDYLDFDKDAAKEEMKEKVGWRDYGGKHHESIFTKFYQNYILPEKFGVDKRRAHLASLINAGQMTRKEALAELEKPLYDPRELREDKAYVIKKLGFTEAEFEEILKAPPRSHFDFQTNQKVKGYYHKFISTAKSIIKS